MHETHDMAEDPVGAINLSDFEQDDVNGGTWTVIPSVTTPWLVSRRTICGTCGINSTGCC